MFFMDARERLQLSDPDYQKAVQLYVWGAYLLDHPKRDVSTKAFLGTGRETVLAQVQANEEGVLAGLQEAEWLIGRLGLTVLRAKKDGSVLKKGEVFLEFRGRAAAVLGVERTLLNLLQRMSGVATKTRRLKIKLSKGMRLLATRKTLWGPLDKRAVVLGGGESHRLNLSDAILIKDNHLALSDNFAKSLRRAFKRASYGRFIEVELQTVQQVSEFLPLYKKYGRLLSDNNLPAVMLDNFSPRDIRKVIRQLNEMGLFVEISGGITEKNATRYNIAGVSAVSSGAITACAENLDMSLQINRI